MSFIDTMNLLDNENDSKIFTPKWRESLNKYKKNINIEIEEWVSNTTTIFQSMKKEISETIRNLHQERREDTTIFLNSFLEKERFSQQFPTFSQHSEKKYTIPRKRKYDEMEM